MTDGRVSRILLHQPRAKGPGPDNGEMDIHFYVSLPDLVTNHCDLT